MSFCWHTANTCATAARGGKARSCCCQAAISARASGMTPKDFWVVGDADSRSRGSSRESQTAVQRLPLKRGNMDSSSQGDAELVKKDVSNSERTARADLL